MTLPTPLSMWEYVVAGPQRGMFFLPVLVDAHEVVAVQYCGESVMKRMPIPPDYSWLGSVIDFYAHFRPAHLKP